jgi:hypothetical protein
LYGVPYPPRRRKSKAPLVITLSYGTVVRLFTVDIELFY